MRSAVASMVSEAGAGVLGASAGAAGVEGSATAGAGARPAMTRLPAQQAPTNASSNSKPSEKEEVVMV